MSLQKMVRRVGYINRKAMLSVAAFALVAQPLGLLFAGTTASALSSGPFSLEAICQSEKVTLKLQAKQEVPNWVTGNVTYKTAFGQVTHDLSHGDVDTWSVATNQTEIVAGSAQARIAGAYLFGWFDKTFTVNYDVLNCDSTKPGIVVNTLNGAVNPGTISVTATDNYRLAQVTAHMYNETNTVLKKNCSENIAASQVATYTLVCSTASLADGIYTIRANARDTAGLLSTTLSSTKFVIDHTKPTVTLKPAPDTTGTGPYKKVSFKLYDAQKIDKAEVNGKLIPLTDDTWSDLNNITVGGAMGGKLGENIVRVYDVAGNVTEVNFILDNTAPTAAFTYSNNNGNAVTKDDVTVTMKTNEPIVTPTGWTKVTDTEFTKIYSENGKHTLTISDIAGNTTVVNFEVKRIDKTAPVISGIADGQTYKGSVTFVATDQNLSKIKVNGSDVPFESTGGWSYAPKTAITGNGAYTITAIDKAGNQTNLSITIDNSISVTVDDVDGTTATPTITGSAIWNADNTPAINVPVKVTVGGAEYSTVTDNDGKWSVTASPALANDTYTFIVNAGTGEASGSKEGTFTVAAPAPTNNVSVATPASALISTIPARTFAFAAPANATDETPASNPNTSESSILGSETTNTASKDAAVAGTSTEKTNVWNYWWILAIIAAIVAGWWMIAAYRRKRAEQEA